MAFDSSKLIGKWRFKETITAQTTFSVYMGTSLNNWFATGDQSRLHSYSTMKLEGNVLKYDYDNKVAFDGSVWKNNQYGDEESYRTISIFAVPTSFNEDLGIPDIATFYEWMRVSASKISDDPGAPCQLAAPKISITGSVISWESVQYAGSYDVYYAKLTGDGTPQLITTTTNTSIDILEHLDTPGTYAFLVTAKPYNDTTAYDFVASGYSNVIDYKVQPRLDTPTTRLVDGVLSWNEIENADHYEVYSGNNLLCNTTETSCNLKKHLFRNAYNYQVMVKACPSSDSYRASEFSVALTFRQDTIVTDDMLIGEWKFNDEIVFEDDFYLANEDEEYMYRWFYAGSHDNKYYLLRTSNRGLVYTNQPSNEKKWEIVYNEGWNASKYQSIGIYRVPNSMSLYDYSIETFYNWLSNNATKTSDTVTAPIKLATPTLSITSSVLIWNAITNASSYEVVANAYDDNGNLISGRQWYAATTNSDIYEHIDLNNTYYIKVRAIGDNEQTYADSDFSNEVVYTTVIEDDRKWLDAPIVALNGKYLVWNLVNNADYYKIHYSDGTYKKVDKNQSVYDLNPTGTPTKLRVSLQACAGDGSEWLDSPYSEWITYDPYAETEENEDIIDPDNDADAIHITVRYVNGVLLATANKYCDKNIQIHLDYVTKVNLIPGNIRSGVTILGVTGTLKTTVAKEKATPMTIRKQG